jgi:hemerythrin-like domain-containing protein
LRKHAGELAHEAMQKLQALEAEHVTAKRSHQVVEELGQEWLSRGSLPPAQADDLAAHLCQLSSIYERHIAIEDMEIFPLAGKVLEAGTLEQVGQEMARRRGQNFRSPFNPRVN